MGDIFDKKVVLGDYSSKYLDIGWHDVFPRNFEYNADNPEKPFVNITFCNAAGASFRDKFFLTKNGMWWWVKFAMCFGVDKSENLSAREVVSRIKDKKVRINITKRTGTDGKEYTNISAFEKAIDEGDIPYEDFQKDKPGATVDSRETVGPESNPDYDPF